MSEVSIHEGIGQLRGTEQQLVLVVDDRVINFHLAITAAGLDVDAGIRLRDVIQDWQHWQPIIDSTADFLRNRPDAVHNWEVVSDVVFDAPVLSDAMLVFTAANYASHTAEAEASDKVGQQVTTNSNQPYVFLKPVRSVVGPTDSIVKPSDVTQLDWEVELAVMIAREGRRIPVDEAMSYVGAYLLCNDMSARDYVRRSDWPMFSSDWFGQKAFDTFTPMGPVLVPASQVPHPDQLRLQLWVGDELMQDGLARDMIFSIAEQISYVSRFTTLKPGDIVSTGTPSGVGMASGRYLNVGEILTLHIPGLGHQRSVIVSESETDQNFVSLQ
ncbi:MAG: fumarylacetoacetate hydrolase family protein [Actinomycetes bacterium]